MLLKVAADHRKQEDVQSAFILQRKDDRSPSRQKVTRFCIKSPLTVHIGDVLLLSTGVR